MDKTGLYSTAFVRIHTLTSGHSDTVNCTAFSPDGCYLASGSDDHSLIIWNISDGHLLYRLLFQSPVDCVLWHPNACDTILIGCQSGHLFQLRNFSLMGSEQREIRLGARSPIHCLDYNVTTKCLAVGVGQEVHITHEEDENHYSGNIKLPNPPTPGHFLNNDDQRLRAVTVQFSKDGRHLIVSYLAHGIICWDVDARSQLWSITPPSDSPYIGHSALSPDGHHIVVHNLLDGLHLYAAGPIKKQVPRRSYKFETVPRTKLRLQVAYLHQGQSLVCGTTTGNVCVWETATGEYFQLLAHDEDAIQAISTCQRGNLSYIATASAGKGQARIRRDDGLGEVVVDAIHAVTSTSNRLLRPHGEFRRRTMIMAVVVGAILMMCIATWGIYITGNAIPWAVLVKTAMRLLWNISSFSVVLARKSINAGQHALQTASNMLERVWDSLVKLVRLKMREFILEDVEDHTVCPLRE